MSMNVGAISGDSSSNNKVKARPEKIIVTKNDTLTKISSRFGMTPNQFKEWVGLSKNKITEGQVIELPTAEVKKGKGIYALAREYGMSISEFAKLNNVPKDYSAKIGERFYVISKNGKKIEDNSHKADKLASELENKIKNMKPNELALEMKDIMHGYFKSIKSDKFKSLMNAITPKNVNDVIEAYEKLDTGESLINAITSEIGSSKEYRKELVMNLYNNAMKLGHVNSKQQADFKAELDNQFDSFGMVNTKQLDKMMNIALGRKVENNDIDGRNNVEVDKPVNKADLRRVYPTKNKGHHTVSSLQNDAIKSATKEALEKYKEFCRANNIKFNENDLDMGAINRIPPPVINEDGKIVPSETELLRPTTIPNGKVVILNPGHGGYSSRTGYFDPGSYSFIKKGNGKYAPLLEGDKMRFYAEKSAEELRANGYAVVITNFHAQTLTDQKSIKSLITRLQNGQKGSKAYDAKDISFISFHADSGSAKEKDTAVCFDPKFDNDGRFANSLNDNLNSTESDNWVKSKLSERKWGKNGLQVLHQSENVPSVLVEVEYVNGAKSKNLDSSAYQYRFVNKIVNGLNDYYNLDK